MMGYLTLLNNSYDVYSTEDGNYSKRAFLAEEIFDVTTYDVDVSDQIGGRILQVCDAITNRTTFQYINQSDDNLLWYTVICNLPFVINRIDWGTSIRGAWWAKKQMDLNSCGLYDHHGEQILSINFSSGDWGKFMEAIMEFGK